MAGSPKRLKLRPSRKINVGAVASKESRVEAVHDAQVRYVFRHPKFPIIRGALQEGVKITEIARWFAAEGWLSTVNEKTFTSYLYAFKARHPEMCSGGDADTIDALVSAHQPDVDVMTELNRLYRLQKVRIAIDVKQEQAMGKLFNTTVKEVEQAHELVNTMAKITGKLGTAGSAVDNNLPSESAEHIRALRVDEGARERMFQLTGKLIGKLSNHAALRVKAKA